MKRLIWLLVLALCGCGVPTLATPPPTLQAINLYYPASLQPWAEMLSSCAAANPQTAVYFAQITNPPSEFPTDTLVLSLGQPIQPIAGYYLDQLGWEQVVVIVNQANPITQLSTDQLKEIFSGQMETWKEGAQQTIQIWVLPDSEPTRQIFDSALQLIQPLAANAMLAPNPEAMMTAISKDPGAIGYLPQSFLNSNGLFNSEKVKLVNLDTPIKGNLHQPVIAITRTEPAGALRDLVVCLQNTNP
jgi:hypothetical protein